MLWNLSITSFYTSSHAPKWFLGPNSTFCFSLLLNNVNKERKSEYFEYVDFLTNIGISYTEPELLKLWSGLFCIFFKEFVPAIVSSVSAIIQYFSYIHYISQNIITTVIRVGLYLCCPSILCAWSDFAWIWSIHSRKNRFVAMISMHLYNFMSSNQIVVSMIWWLIWLGMPRLHFSIIGQQKYTFGLNVNCSKTVALVCLPKTNVLN